MSDGTGGLTSVLWLLRVSLMLTDVTSVRGFALKTGAWLEDTRHEFHSQCLDNWKVSPIHQCVMVLIWI